MISVTCFVFTYEDDWNDKSKQITFLHKFVLCKYNIRHHLVQLTIKLYQLLLKVL